jgi:hypothetical protein
MEIACDESIEAQRDGCRLRGHGALVSHPFALQRSVLEQYFTRTIAGVDGHERMRIGGHRINGIQSASSSTMPRKPRSLEC